MTILTVEELINILSELPNDFEMHTSVAVNGEGFYLSEEPISAENIEICIGKIVIHCD